MLRLGRERGCAPPGGLLCWVGSGPGSVVVGMAGVDRAEGLDGVLDGAAAGQVAERIAAQGGSAVVHQLDVTDAAAISELAATLDRCDVLVANAGGGGAPEP